MAQMRITSVYANTPTFDDDIAVLMRDEHLQGVIDSIHGVNRSNVINFLVHQAAELCKSGRSPITI